MEVLSLAGLAPATAVFVDMPGEVDERPLIGLKEAPVPARLGLGARPDQPMSGNRSTSIRSHFKQSAAALQPSIIFW